MTISFYNKYISMFQFILLTCYSIIIYMSYILPLTYISSIIIIPTIF